MSVTFHSENIEMEETDIDIYGESYEYDDVGNAPSQQTDHILQPAIHAQLSTLEMRLNVTESHSTALRAQLSTLEMKLNVTESRLEEVKRHNAAFAQVITTETKMGEALRAQLSTLEMRLNVTESRLEEVERHNAVSSWRKCSSILLPVVAVGLLGLLLLAGITVGVHLLVKVNGSDTKMEGALRAQLSTLEMRLNVTESRLEEVKRHNAEFVKVNATEAKMEEALRAQLSTLEMRLNVTERHNADQPKVAFSAGLGNGKDYGFVGPYSSTTTLVYQNIFTNIGNAYDTTTGVFHAPVKGAYYFRFTAGTRGPSQYVRIAMYKNGHLLIQNWAFNDHAGFEYLPNGVVVEMEQGDTVDMRLDGGFKLFDNYQIHNTFSGFLLFPH